MNVSIKIAYHTDVLCFWAYAAQNHLDKLEKKFLSKIQIDQHFISIFGDTKQRIGCGWEARGGYAGFAEHLIEVSAQFPHLTLNPDIWCVTRPKTSALAHLYIKAVQLMEQQELITAEIRPENNRSLVEEFIWQIRSEFFENAHDISQSSVLNSLAEDLCLPMKEIEALVNDGSALAALTSDMEKKDLYKLEGSPSYVMNDGRQKLYGNVGYRVIEANVIELFEHNELQCSAC